MACPFEVVPAISAPQAPMRVTLRAWRSANLWVGPVGLLQASRVAALRASSGLSGRQHPDVERRRLRRRGFQQCSWQRDQNAARIWAGLRIEINYSLFNLVLLPETCNFFGDCAT